MVIIGIPIVIGVLVWNFLPSGSATAKVGVQVPKAKALADTQTAVKTDKRLLDEQAMLTPQVAQMSYDVPADELVPRTIRDLQTLAAKSGVHLREIKPARPRNLPSGAGASVPLDVRFLAPFQPNTMKFLYYVEDPTGKMVVDKLDITSADPKRKTVEVAAQVTVFTRRPVGTGRQDGGDTTDVTDKTARN